MAVAPKPFVKTALVQQGIAIVGNDGKPAPWFVRLLNDNAGNLGAAINQIAVLPLIQQALADAQQAVIAAQTAADTATSAAAQAQGQADATKREAALQASYIDPSSVLSATATTITIAAHTRRYGDGTSASINGGTLPATGSGQIDFVFYDDPVRTGGSVVYQVGTNQPVQSGDRHVVGAVQIPPATATQPVEGGEGPQPPGKVYPTKRFATDIE